jgi:hypothetical protein
VCWFESSPGLPKRLKETTFQPQVMTDNMNPLALHKIGWKIVYAWNSTQINDWFKKVMVALKTNQFKLPDRPLEPNRTYASRKAYKFQDKEELKKQLENIYGWLKRISFIEGDNKGPEDYVSPRPMQYIHRREGKRKRGDKDWSLQLVYYGNPDIDFRFWSPYDLLGQFLSLIAVASPSDELENYFIPLVAVYAKWCSSIAGTSNADARNHRRWPSCFQVTWRCHESLGIKEFRLGASLAGYDNSQREFVTQIKTERYNLLPANLLPRGASLTSAPRWNAATGTGYTYGNCAETYPFKFLLQPEPYHVQDNADVFGVAIKTDFLHYQRYQTWPGFDRFYPEMDKPLCGNCKDILGTCTPDLRNFVWEEYIRRRV